MAPDVSSHPFLTRFPAAQAAKLAGQVKLVRYKSKALIFDEGTPSDCIYLVLSGRVVLTKKTPGGAPQIIAYKGPADYFGELGVLDGSTRSTAARAEDSIQLARLPQQAFLDVLSESSWQTVLRLFSHLSENLRATNARYVTEVVRKEKITLIGEMANSMIHDFRNPFTTIRLAAESVALGHEDEKTRKLSTMILRQVDRLGVMVEEVLEFARGETRLRARSIPLQEVLTQLQENNPPASLAGVRLEVKSSTLVLQLDPDRILRVLQNLVSNARETLTQRKDGSIIVAARRRKNHCILIVADNGGGIPAEIRSSLFEPFVSHGKVGGTGLGLALAKSVVEAHHGTIAFRTSPAGTIFIIQLPIHPTGK